MLAGFVGICIGAGTLGAAIWAAIFAKHAAEAGKAAVAETRRIGEAQVRCYIDVGTAVLEMPDTGALTLQIVVANSGQSPARQLRWDWRIRLREAGGGTRWQSPEIYIVPTTAGLSIAAGKSKSTFAVKGDLVLDSPTRNRLVDSQHLFCDIVVDLQWQDVFGAVFEERIRFDATFRPSDYFGKPISLQRYTAQSEESLSH